MGYLLLGNIKKQAERAHHKLYHFVGNSVWLDFINIPLTQVLQGCHCSMVVRVHLKYENKMEKFKMRCELCHYNFLECYVYIVNFLECKKNWDKQSKINVIFCLRKLDNFLEGYKWKWFSSIALISSKLDFYFMYLESSQNSC